MPVSKARLDTVLVIDDDPNMSALVEGLLGSTALVTSAIHLIEGLRLAARQRFDLIVLDHRLPDGRGLEKIAELMAQDRLRPILYITAQSGSQTAIEAIKLGAFDYLSKPVDFEHFKNRLEQALEYRHLTRVPVLVDTQKPDANCADVLIGRCQSMQEVYKSIGRLARLNAPVLVEGEVGTGKELVGRTIHRHSCQGEHPFIKIEKEELVAALHRWDGQTSDSMDRSFTLTNSLQIGTIFVEELCELSMADQGRLLRLLQGLSRQKDPACRVMIANSIPSQKLLESGKLRSDLFYFLSPYLIRLPALRDRGSDLDLLVSHFMNCLAHIAPAAENQGPPRVSQTAMAHLHNYSWPGNVAQLKSVLQGVLMESIGAVLATDTLTRAISLGATTVDIRQSMLPSIPSHSQWDVGDFVERRVAAGTQSLYEEAVLTLEQMLLRETLFRTRGNQAQAAKLLGITRTSLRKKIAQAGIDVLKLTAPGAGDAVLN